MGSEGLSALGGRVREGRALPVPNLKHSAAGGALPVLNQKHPAAGRALPVRPPHIPSTSFIPYSPGARPAAHSAARTAPVA